MGRPEELLLGVGVVAEVATGVAAECWLLVVRHTNGFIFEVALSPSGSSGFMGGVLMTPAMTS